MKYAVLFFAFFGLRTQAATIDSELRQYQNGAEILDRRAQISGAAEGNKNLKEVIDILAHLAGDHDNPECGILSVRSLKDAGVEVITRTGATLQLQHLGRTSLIESTEGEGFTSNAPFGPLASPFDQEIGPSFEMVHVRSLNQKTTGRPGTGDAYTDLRVYYATTATGLRLLKVQVNTMLGEHALIPLPHTSLKHADLISGACEAHPRATK